MSRLSAAIVMLVAAILAASASVTVADTPATVSRRATVVAEPFGSPATAAVIVEVRAALAKGSQWGIEAGGVSIVLHTPSRAGADNLAPERIRLTVSRGDSVVASTTLPDGWATGPHDENTLEVQLSRDGHIEIAGGRTRIAEVAEARTGGVTPQAVDVVTDGQLNVYFAAVEAITDPAAEAFPRLSPEQADSIIGASTDPIAGYWQLLDADINTALARPGGRYTLAIISDGTGGYEVLYGGGAEINPELWQPGAVKATMRPTILQDDYAVSWTDASRRRVNTAVTATLEQSALLTFHFPAYGARLRFAKLPARGEDTVR